MRARILQPAAVGGQPAAEPLHLDEVKGHLRVPDNAEDTQIAGYLSAARALVEARAQILLVAQTRVLHIRGSFPGVIELPQPPLLEVVSVAYLDTDGNSQTLAASQYDVLRPQGQRARIEPAYNVSWPATRATWNSVSVTFRAGHLVPVTADEGGDTLTAQGYTPADDSVWQVSNSGGSLPAGLSARTDYYVVNSGATLQLSTTEGGSPVDLTDAGTGQTYLGRLPDTLRAYLLLLVGLQHTYREIATEENLHKLPGMEALLDSESVRMGFL